MASSATCTSCIARHGGGSPSDMLLTDRPLLACVALWGIAVVTDHLSAVRVVTRLCDTIESRHPQDVAGDGPAGLPRGDEPGRLPGRHRQGRRHRAQGQHLLALLLPRLLDHAVAARRRDPRDEAGRLRPGPDPRLPQPHRRHRRAPRRAREQAAQRRRGARPAQRPPLRGRGVDQRPRRRRRPDRRSSSA